MLVLAGFGLGILCGLFFGEMAAVLDPVGRAYVRLLQMAVLPYIVVSLIAGLGRLSPSQASRMAVWGGAVLFVILGGGMLIVLASPLSYPDWAAASYFSSSLLADSDSVDFVSLYIPANPFNAAANTVVPAVVLFSIVMGVAVMVSEKKAKLLDVLESLDEALMNITRFIVKLAPIGIFAIAANAAGTLDISAFGKLQVYVATFLLLWAMFFFLLLPGLLISLTPVKYREVFKALRIPFVTAFVTGSVLVVVPMLIERIKGLLAHHGLADEETDAAVDVMVPTAYNFPSVAMLLALSFIPFAGWYAGSELSAAQYPQFASVGLFVAFGGTTIALPFLLDMFRLPADMFQLFLVANVVTNFFFTLLSVMNLAVLTMLTLFFIKRRIKFLPLFLGILIAISSVGVPLALKGQGALFDSLVEYEYTGYSEFVSRELTIDPVGAASVEYQPGVAERYIPRRLDRIGSEGVLRVGYSPDALPWAFRNSDGAVVGYDMELIHRLARDFEVGLELVRVDQDDIQHALDSGQIDLHASGMMMDAGLARDHVLSRPYTDVALGVLVADHRRQEFESIELIRENSGLSFAIVNAPTLERTLELHYPDLHISDVNSPRAFLRGEMEGVDALIMPAEAASAWTMVYPDYAAIVPSHASRRVPLVFVLPKDDETFRQYINDWLMLTESMGVMDRAFQHWILGRDLVKRKPRWSVIRDVLYWVD